MGTKSHPSPDEKSTETPQFFITPISFPPSVSHARALSRSPSMTASSASTRAPTPCKGYFTPDPETPPSIAPPAPRKSLGFPPPSVHWPSDSQLEENQSFTAEWLDSQSQSQVESTVSRVVPLIHPVGIQRAEIGAATNAMRDEPALEAPEAAPRPKGIAGQQITPKDSSHPTAASPQRIFDRSVSHKNNQRTPTPTKPQRRFSNPMENNSHGSVISSHSPRSSAPVEVPSRLPSLDFQATMDVHTIKRGPRLSTASSSSTLAKPRRSVAIDIQVSRSEESECSVVCEEPLEEVIELGCKGRVKGGRRCQRPNYTYCWQHDPNH